MICHAIGNAATGAKLFLQCRAGHAVSPVGTNGVGPHPTGVIGAKAASKPGFTFLPALKNAALRCAALRCAALRWDAAKMDAWLTPPAKVAPGDAAAASAPTPISRYAPRRSFPDMTFLWFSA